MNAEQRARELLAEECGRSVEEMHYERFGVTNTQVALRAIARALQQQGGSEGVRGLVAGLRESITDYGDHGENLRNEVIADLLNQIDRIDAALAAMGGEVGGEDWKARAIAAEADIERMTDAFNRENGPTFMGEPVLPPEKMVELELGVKVPVWLLDHAQRIELYMKLNLPGPWRIGGIQSHDYATPTPPPSAVPEWRPIESAPMDYTRVLLTDCRTVEVGFYDAERREWMTDSGWVYGLSEQPANWMPLPAAPEPGEADDAPR